MDPTSQYEYWLSRRLKDEYNVVNKGYGQEKTNDMLERFDRDIASLGAHYCIILGGTNDYVITYIVRCNRKLLQCMSLNCWNPLKPCTTIAEQSRYEGLKTQVM